MKNLNQIKNGATVRIELFQTGALAERFGKYGIYTGSILTKIDKDDARYPTLKIKHGDASISLPGQLAKKIEIASADTKNKSLYNLTEGSEAVIRSIKGKREIQALELLELKPESNLTLLRKLPHMEYAVLTNNRERFRITESFAALIVGRHKDLLIQFAYARRDEPFVVEHIIANRECTAFLNNRNISEGSTIVLEGIEPGKDVCFDEKGTLYLYHLQGYRIQISKKTAEGLGVTETA